MVLFTLFSVNQSYLQFVRNWTNELSLEVLIVKCDKKTFECKLLFFMLYEQKEC